MTSRWIPALALRIAIYFVIVPLAFVVVVPDAFETIHWWLTHDTDPAIAPPIAQPAQHAPELPPAQIAAPPAQIASPPAQIASPHAQIASPHAQVVSPPAQGALPPLPPVHALLAEAERIQGLFDQGRMHALYANFSDAAKAQVPEEVFVAQASEVLTQLGPRKPDGWGDADRLSTFLNGRSTGRKQLLWKLHPDSLTFDVGSVRFGSMADSSEDLVLDLSGGQVKLAMFYEFKHGPVAASIWLPRTCSHSGEDPLKHCTVPGAPAIANAAIAIPTPRHARVSPPMAIGPDGHAAIAHGRQ